jgi:hypothetical protein
VKQEKKMKHLPIAEFEEERADREQNFDGKITIK